MSHLQSIYQIFDGPPPQAQLEAAKEADRKAAELPRALDELKRQMEATSLATQRFEWTAELAHFMPAEAVAAVEEHRAGYERLLREELASLEKAVKRAREMLP